jgi:hypothetical protein
MAKEEDAMTEDDREHYGAIVQAIENGVKTLRSKGAPAHLLTMALMHVAVRCPRSQSTEPLQGIISHAPHWRTLPAQH